LADNCDTVPRGVEKPLRDAPIVTRQFGHARLDRAFRSLLALLMGGLFAAALAACDSSPSPTGRADQAPPAATSVGGLEYRLGVGDKVKVVVLGQSDLGGELEVDAGGKIVVALIGEVAAAGRSVGQVQDEIRGKFSQGILREPKVTVQVVGYRPVTVLGQVKQAGRYPFSFGMDVRGAVAMAGGYERRGSTDSAIIFRAGQKLEAGPETPLAPGDTIEIPRKFF
jgi:polysaccharide export outer membrane protein